MPLKTEAENRFSPAIRYQAVSKSLSNASRRFGRAEAIGAAHIACFGIVRNIGS